MATKKVLQIPKIVEIVGSTIRVAHPRIRGNLSNSLAASIAAGGTAMGVYDNNGLADNDWLLVGQLGNRQTEATDVNGAVTRGQSLTVTNYLKFAHGLDTPITKIFELGIKIYGAAADGGAGTLIASIDAITASAPQLADTVMMQWDKPYTEYTLITTDTAYDFYYATFTDGVTESDASLYVPSTGVSYNKIQPLLDQALVFSNSKIDGQRITNESLLDWYNDCLDAVKQFTYQDPGSGRWLQKDWSFEAVLDEGITLVEGEDTYALSELTYPTKYPNSDKSIISVAIGNEKAMNKIAIRDFDLKRRGVNKTYTNGAAAIGDIVLTVDSTANFPDTGSITADGQTITYTAKTATQFTGIPASGTGAITAILADNVAVWQGMSNGKALNYTLFNGNLILEYPVSSAFAGYKLKVRHFRSLERADSSSEGTEIPFTNVVTKYIVATILFRLGQAKQAEDWMADFKKQMTSNAQADYIPMLDSWRYYNFQDDIFDEGETYNNF